MLPGLFIAAWDSVTNNRFRRGSGMPIASSSRTIWFAFYSCTTAAGCSLQRANALAHFSQNTCRRLWIFSFCVNAQHLLGPGSPHKQPALLLHVQFVPVEILAAFDAPLQHPIHAPAEVLDCFFFLPGAQLEVHAPVVMLAEFLVQHFHQFAEPLSVPRHHFGEEQSADRRITLRQIHFRRESTAFFPAQQDVRSEERRVGKE